MRYVVFFVQEGDSECHWIKDAKGRCDAIEKALPDFDFSEAHDRSYDSWQEEAYNGDCLIHCEEVPE